VLVATVLRPEEGEDGELEVVRIPAEQLFDSPRFPVRETEGPVERLVERLIGDIRQVIQCIRDRGGALTRAERGVKSR
jgi:hypothetical protein